MVAGAIGRAGLAAGTLGVGDGVAFGERGGLALGRPAQPLHLTTQPLVDLLEPFAFGPQPLVLPTQPLAFGLQPLVLALQPLLLLSQRGVLVLKPSDPLAQPTHASRIPTGLHTRGHPHHEAEGYNQPIRRQAPAISIRPLKHVDDALSEVVGPLLREGVVELQAQSFTAAGEINRPAQGRSVRPR